MPAASTNPASPSGLHFIFTFPLLEHTPHTTHLPCSQRTLAAWKQRFCVDARTHTEEEETEEEEEVAEREDEEDAERNTRGGPRARPRYAGVEDEFSRSTFLERARPRCPSGWRREFPTAAGQ